MKVENDTPQTVQTVQIAEELPEDIAEEAPERTPWIELAKQKDGKVYWCLWSATSRPMARSVIGYRSTNDAKQAAECARKLMANAPFAFMKQ